MPTISMKNAVSIAKENIKTLYEDDPLQGLALEEIELVTDGGRERWAVTLGFFRAKSVKPHSSVGTSIFLPQAPIENRVYKIVMVDANTGDFIKMDIRTTP
jgi:hypothetical protein